MNTTLEEFKKFLMRGNVIDLATAVLIGGAFNKIVTSLANNIISPIVGVFMGGYNLEDRVYTIYGTNAQLGYGSFLQSVIDFIITATIIFFLLKLSTKMFEIANRKKKQERKKKEEDKPAEPTETELLKEIRDLLKKR